MNRIIFPLFLTLVFMFGCSQPKQPEEPSDPPPMAELSGHSAGNEGEVLLFEGKISGIEGKELQVHWDYGDDKQEESSTIMTSSAYLCKTLHTYSEPGEYDVTLTVTDNQGRIDTASLSVSISNVKPWIERVKIPKRVGLNQVVTLTGEGSDPGGGNLYYEWKLTSIGKEISTTLLGQTVDYSWDEPGTKSIAIRVRDESGSYSFNEIENTIIVHDSDQEIYEIGPEVFGIRIGTPFEIAKEILLEKGFMSGGRIITGGEMLNFAVPVSDPWVNIKGRVYNIDRKGDRFSSPVNGCIPSSIFVLIEEGMVSGIGVESFLEGRRQCYKEFNNLLDGLDEYDFGDAYSYGDYMGFGEERIRYFKGDQYVLRCFTALFSGEGGGGISTFLMEGRMSDEMVPELKIKPSKRTSPHVFTHINYPIPFTAEGVDFIANSSPGFEWDQDYEGSVEGFEVDVTGPSATFTWDKSGSYKVALKGISTNGKASIKTVDVIVSAHEYSKNNMSVAELIQMDLPNQIISQGWGEDLGNIGNIIKTRVNHVIESKTYESDGLLSGYLIRVQYPSFFENSAFNDIRDAIVSKFGNSQAGNEDKGWLTVLWSTEDYYLKIYGYPADVWLEVLYKPLWDNAKLVQHGGYGMLQR